MNHVPPVLLQGQVLGTGALVYYRQGRPVSVKQDAVLDRHLLVVRDPSRPPPRLALPTSLQSPRVWKRSGEPPAPELIPHSRSCPMDQTAIVAMQDRFLDDM